MDGEQRHAYFKSADVHAVVVRKEDFTVRIVSEQGTQVADDLVLDIPVTSSPQSTTVGVVNADIGTLREQLEHVDAV
jgi:hypothetical protein